MQTQGSIAQSPQPVGSSGQLEKRANSLCVELLEFIQRQDSGPTETVSEASGHMAAAPAVTPLGLLHMRPHQQWLHD